MMNKRRLSSLFLVLMLFFSLLQGVFNEIPSIPTVSALDNSVYGWGTTRIADNGSWNGIQKAIDESKAGDLVLIPDGIWDFAPTPGEWHRINLTAGVSIGSLNYTVDPITGIPTSHQVLLNISWKVLGSRWTNNSDPAPKNMFWSQGTNNFSENSRIFGFQINGYRATDPTVSNFTNTIHFESLQHFRIDHMTFLDVGGVAITTLGRFGNPGSPYYPQNCSGVIDHNNLTNRVWHVEASWFFTDSQYGVNPKRRSASDIWDDNLTNIYGQYTFYSVYIENNFFSGWRHEVASNDGSHYVFRYNTINESSGFGSLDQHGGTTFNGTHYTQVGGRASEYYENVIINATQNIWGTFTRGGATMVFNNTFGGGTYTIFVNMDNDVGITNLTKTRIQDTYIWDNTLIGGETLVNVIDPDGWIIENEQYYLFEPNGTGTVPSYEPYQYPHPLTQDPPSAGWNGTIIEVTNPTSIMGVSKTNITSVNGVS